MAAPAAAIALGQEVVDLVALPVAHEGFEHGVVVGIHDRPPWSPGVTTSQVRSGVQRYLACANETRRVPAKHSGTQKSLERNFRWRGRSAPPASSGRRRRAPRTETPSNSGSELSNSSESRWGNCEQFPHLIKEAARPGALGSPAPDGDACARTRIRVFSCPGCVLRGVGAPPRAFRPARMQPNRSWRWRESNRPSRGCKSRRQRCARALSRQNTVSVTCRI